MSRRLLVVACGLIYFFLMLPLLVRVAERATDFFPIASRFNCFMEMRLKLFRNFAVEPIAAKDIDHAREE